MRLLRPPVGGKVITGQAPPLGAFQVVVLAAFQRSQEADEAEAAEEERDRDEIDQDVHDTIT